MIRVGAKADTAAVKLKHPQPSWPLCDICRGAGTAPQSVHCIIHSHFFKYGDADLNALWKLPSRLCNSPVSQCIIVMTTFLKMAPADQTGPDRSRKRTKRGLWPRCCSHTSTANHRESKPEGKTGLDVLVGICIKTIFVEELVCNITQNAWKSKWHVANMSNCMSSFLSSQICRSPGTLDPVLSAFRHIVRVLSCAVFDGSVAFILF